MVTQTAISLAVLQVNWDERKKDYLDNFVPIIAECIRLQKDEVVSTGVLKTDIESRFGLNIPASAVNTILRRLRRDHYVYIKDGIYYRNSETLSSHNFREVQQTVVSMHDSLISDLIAYCKKESDLDWSPEEASNNLLSCLKENGLQIISGFTADTIIPDTVSSTKSGKYHCALYIKHLADTMSGLLDYINKLAEGHMLANAIFLPDPMRASQNFRNTKVFFDTSFLIFALGYAGEARQAPCTELLNLLYETGAELCCFPHTVAEMIGILHSCSQRLREGQQTDAFGTIEYFIEKRYTDSDIQMLVNSMKTNLDSLRITIKDKPPYMPKYVIDEAALGGALEKEISYRSSYARDRDVDSISAIMRLRHMNHYNFIEDCRALFITTNTAVARVSRIFFYGSTGDAFVAPCITDYSLTNLLWLKAPLKMPDLPMKRIIADCYASLQPDEKLMRSYLSKIEKLEREHQATEEEVFMLRYSLEARQALMDLTSGDEQVLSNLTIRELLEIVRERMQAKLRTEIEAKAQKQIDEIAQDRDKYKALAAERTDKLERAEGTVKELTASETARNTHVTARARKIAFIIARLIGSLFILILILGSVYLFPWHLPSFLESPLRYIFPICFIGLFLYTIISYITGFHVAYIVRKLELTLERPLRNVINNLVS